MNWLRILLAPLLGGIIGYITNDLAIRMLFRPRKALYIGKFHVPLTPGLIPRQQGRIASSVGEVVSSQLLGEETLRETLLSEKTLGMLREKVTGFLRGLAKDERTIGQVVKGSGLPEKLELSGEEVQQKLTDALSRKITEAQLGYAILDSVLKERMESIAQNKLLSKFFDGNTQEAFREKLAGKINEIIAEKAPDASAAIVRQAKDTVLEARVCDLYERHRDKEDKVVEGIVGLYASLLGDNLGRLLRAINIQQIVVDKINSLDPAELETALFGVMKHELRAIVYLGAALGFLMGFLNLFLG